MATLSPGELATLRALAQTFVVNPMITVMAMARRVSRTVLAEGSPA